MTDNPNAPDEYGNTPIYLAASWGYTEIIRILAPLSDDPYVPDESKNEEIRRILKYFKKKHNPRPSASKKWVYTINRISYYNQIVLLSIINLFKSMYFKKKLETYVDFKECYIESIPIYFKPKVV